MAYRPRSSRSSRAPARSRGAPRGGRGRAGGGSGGGAGPMVAAVVIVIAVIGIVIALQSGKGEKEPRAQTPPASTPSPRDTDTGPAEPRRLPPPPLPEHLKTEAQELVTTARELSDEGERIYAQAVAAKEAGDLDRFQDLLDDASQVYSEIQDRYNEIIMQMPSNQDWDEEQVANHYLGREADIITRALSRYADIRKQRTSGG